MSSRCSLQIIEYRLNSPFAIQFLLLTYCTLRSCGSFRADTSVATERVHTHLSCATVVLACITFIDICIKPTNNQLISQVRFCFYFSFSHSPFQYPPLRQKKATNLALVHICHQKIQESSYRCRICPHRRKYLHLDQNGRRNRRLRLPKFRRILNIKSLTLIAMNKQQARVVRG